MKNVPCDFMWHLKEITDDLTKVNQLLDGSELGKSSSYVCYLLKHFQWVVSGRLWVLRRYNLASQGDCSATDGNGPSGLWQSILCNWRPWDLGEAAWEGRWTWKSLLPQEEDGLKRLKNQRHYLLFGGLNKQQREFFDEKPPSNIFNL